MTTDERVEHYLSSLRWWAARPREFAVVWDSPEFDEREREVFPYEWDNVIGRLAKVEALAQRRAPKPAAIVELRAVAEELTELLPTMRRLRLRLPDADALQRARAADAA